MADVPAEEQPQVLPTTHWVNWLGTVDLGETLNQVLGGLRSERFEEQGGQYASIHRRRTGLE